LARELDVAIYLTVRPGDFVDTTMPIAYVTPISDRVRANCEKVAEHVAVSEQREYGADVRFGLVNLAEPADRALSPGINDPGTAIAILGRQLAVMTRWAEVSQEVAARDIVFDHVFIPPLTAVELVRDCFTPIARDGAGMVEVAIRLQKTLAALVRLDVAELTEAAVAMSHEALELAERALVAEAHKIRVRDAAKKVHRLAFEQSKGNAEAGSE